MRVPVLLLLWLATALGIPYAIPQPEEPVTSTSSHVETIDVWNDGHVIGTPDG
ncbi:MAG: hypothetical protein R3338_10860 [Thermoanaerobaculia bacterium]|nr:hypothetical protein [Thermoanaerobaculia bacterium]